MRLDQLDVFKLLIEECGLPEELELDALIDAEWAANSTQVHFASLLADKHCLVKSLRFLPWSPHWDNALMLNQSIKKWYFFDASDIDAKCLSPKPIRH